MRTIFVKYRDTFAKILVILSIMLAVFVFVKYIFGFIAPFVTAFILSLILEPFIRFMTEKLAFKRWLASLVSVIVILYILFFLITTIVVQIVAQAASFLENLPQYMEEMRHLFFNLSNMLNQWGELLPTDVQELYVSANNELFTAIANSLGSSVQKRSLGIVASIPSMLMFTLVSILSTFFICKDKMTINNFFKTQIPKTWLHHYSILKENLFDAMIGYVKAQSILMTFTFVIVLASLSIQRSSYALLLSIIIAVIDALPVFGSGFILWPWAFISIMRENYNMALALIITYAIVFLTRQLLEPKILGKQIGVHPLLTLLSIYVGMKVFGPLGFLLGPMTTILIKALFKANIVSLGERNS